MTTALVKLEKAIANYRNATNVAQRQAARRFCINRAQELQPDRDALMAKLEAGWVWLDRNAGHPDEADTEAMWLDALEDYERMEDALANALAVICGRDETQERRAA